MMHWISLAALEKKLTQNEISQKDSFLFLLVNWMVFGMIGFLVADAQHDNPGVLGMLVIIPAIGLIIGYFANKKGDGKNYLLRMVSLHWVIGVRFFLLFFPLALIMRFTVGTIENIYVKGWLLGIIMIAYGISFYGTIARSMKRVSGQASS